MRPVLPVSVVIATRNRPELLGDLLRSILDGDALPAQIIVADQSTGDGARPLDVVAADGVDLVHLPVHSAGSSRNRNAAIAVATQDLLAFTDDDCIVATDWLREVRAAADAAPPRTVITGTVVAGTDDGFVPSVSRATERQVHRGRYVGGEPFLMNNVAIPRCAFDEVGVFDERLGVGARWFQAAGDNDLCFRLMEAGYAVEFVPSVTVAHVGARRGRQLLALEWRYGVGQGAFYAKHVHWSDRHMLHRLRFDLARQGKRVSGIVRGDRGSVVQAVRSAVHCAGLLVGVTTFRMVYPERRRG
jgi:GT2 family glycosyltransferase